MSVTGSGVFPIAPPWQLIASELNRWFGGDEYVARALLEQNVCVSRSALAKIRTTQRVPHWDIGAALLNLHGGYPPPVSTPDRKEPP